MTPAPKFCCPTCGWDSPNHPHGRYCPDCGGRIELIPPLPREDGLSRELMSEGHGHSGLGTSEPYADEELRAAYLGWGGGQMIEWRNNGKKWSFWKCVLDYATKKCQEHWPFQDRKCPHCNIWQSAIGGNSFTQETWCDDIMHCRQCGKSSRWHNEGIVAWTLPEQQESKP